METKDKLREKIRLLQEKINIIIMQNGFSDYQLLLKLSKELDVLINEYADLIKDKDKFN